MRNNEERRDEIEVTEIKMSVTAKIPGVPDYRRLVSTPSGELRAPARSEVRVDISGIPGLAFAKFDVELIDRRFQVVKLEAKPANGCGLSTYELQQLDMGMILLKGLESEVKWVTKEGGNFFSENPIDSPDSAVGVALTYSVAYAIGGHPVLAVAKDLDISPGAAAQRVRRARKRGYLPPTTPGKAS